MIVVIPVVLSYCAVLMATIPLCVPSIITESWMSADLSNTNLPSIITKESFGGISASLITLIFLVFPDVLDAVLFLLCVNVTVGYVLTQTFATDA